MEPRDLRTVARLFLLGPFPTVTVCGLRFLETVNPFSLRHLRIDLASNGGTHGKALVAFGGSTSCGFGNWGAFKVALKGL